MGSEINFNIKSNPFQNGPLGISGNGQNGTGTGAVGPSVFNKYNKGNSTTAAPPPKNSALALLDKIRCGITSIMGQSVTPQSTEDTSTNSGQTSNTNNTNGTNSSNSTDSTEEASSTEETSSSDNTDETDDTEQTAETGEEQSTEGMSEEELAKLQEEQTQDG